jgi:hypothetical protein
VLVHGGEDRAVHGSRIAWGKGDGNEGKGTGGKWTFVSTA